MGLGFVRVSTCQPPPDERLGTRRRAAISAVLSGAAAERVLSGERQSSLARCSAVSVRKLEARLSSLRTSSW